MVRFLANAKVPERVSAGEFTFDLTPGDGGHCERKIGRKKKGGNMLLFVLKCVVVYR